jgi:positive regulator of sigma E activity
MTTTNTIMLACMQSYSYGENTGSGYTGAPISKCRKCPARNVCDKDTWIKLGGKV